MTETVVLDYEIKSSIEHVWEALTDASILSQWTFFETEDFQAIVGNRFQFRGKAATGWNGIVDGEILVAEKPTVLSYTWSTEGVAGPHRTTVTWTLSSSPEGMTQVHLEQTGFRPEAQQEISGAQYGWTHQLKQLQQLIGSDDQPKP